ncbi:MAG: hypothetical protein IJG81_05805 [Muribaculaceae bacterium]|nr:hypothetical protein [Muribaculaceae bacterium]
MKYILTLVIALAAMVSQAQDDYGKWVLHPIFAGENITNCIDTGDEVYYLASGNLYRYDKDTQENEHLNRANYLNDSGVENIYFNADKNYIMVAYQNSNIDVIDLRNGDVSNISDIKNADISTSKAINSITFAAPNMAIVATDFGFVIINDSKLEVISSYISDKAMEGAMILGKYLIINQGGKFHYAPATKHIQQMSDLSSAWVGLVGPMIPIGDNRFFVLATDQLAVVTATEDNGRLSFSATKVASGRPVTVNNMSDGGYVASFKNTDYYYTTSAAGDNAARHEGAGIYSSSEGGSGMWVLDAQGLKHYNGDTLTDNILPNAISISGVPFWMEYDVANSKLYLTSTADNVILDDLVGETQINTFDGNFWHNVTPDGVPEPDEGCYWPVMSPNEDNTYFISTRKKGFLKIANDKIVVNLNNASCGINDRMAALRFDSHGNLWIVQTRDNEHPVRVLTPAKQAKSQITAQDFIFNTSSHIRNLNSEGFKRSQFTIGNGDTKVFTSGQYGEALVLWNNNSDLSLSKSISFASGALTDQDGKSLDWYEIRSLATDNSGLVWMGTTSGMISFDPNKAFDADFHVTHIKVPRNDGTNLADYLLDGQTVNCIAVDGANRKWIGTEASGLFLVSADGQTVLKNFNATNSVIGSNEIYQVCCDPTGNSVFVTTPLGVAEYKSDATPGQANFNNIYAYPNPVRPDYGGPINITGLMDNSLVKIADPSGNVIRSLKSTGGMVSWDGCNYEGDLVPTGVYTILASQADGSGGGTAKVLIVR